ncbi:MAG: response regulator transcription factor [Verrucomicrobia bacterium]|nr:response regulator transcription factor [Verrucomicrobiota bacterium]
MADSKKTYSILLVDDHPIMRQGLRALIETRSDFKVVGEAATAALGMEMSIKLKPDLAIVDLSLPDRGGLELIKDMRVATPDTRILVLSMHEESFYVDRVLKAGARGYVMKQEASDKLLQAIDKISLGEIAISPAMSSRLIAIFSGNLPNSNPNPVHLLTDREMQVFLKLGEGLTIRQIADALHISVKTAEVHRTNIKSKLGFSKSSEVVHYAIRWIDKQ